MFPKGGQFLAMFPKGEQTRKHCFVTMFPKGGQVLTMFPKGGQTRKQCFLAIFPKGGQIRKHSSPAMFPKRGMVPQLCLPKKKLLEIFACGENSF
jgi:hypothetical protein